MWRRQQQSSMGRRGVVAGPRTAKPAWPRCSNACARLSSLWLVQLQPLGTASPCLPFCTASPCLPLVLPVRVCLFVLPVHVCLFVLPVHVCCILYECVCNLNKGRYEVQVYQSTPLHLCLVAQRMIGCFSFKGQRPVRLHVGTALHCRSM